MDSASDTAGGRLIAITGMGAVSAVGIGRRRLWAAIENGSDGIKQIERFDTSPFTTDLGAVVPDFTGLDGSAWTGCVRYAVTAGREALNQAGLDSREIGNERVGLVLGTILGGDDQLLHLLTATVADELCIGGPRLTVSTACSASTNALGLARELLCSGAVDAVLAGGVEFLTDQVFAGFHALGALSQAKCAPFSFPPGTTLGEGAGFVVLERVEQARRRSAEPLAELTGYGASCDAFHETAPDPTGSGIGRAIHGALGDSGLEAVDIGYINAHGSGTAANDVAEWTAVKRALGSRAEETPISSTKSIIGHAQGAAGALEVVVTTMAMRRRVVPQTQNHVRPRPGCPGDPVAGDRPRAHDYRHALSHNSGFGGANSAVVISRSGSHRPLPIGKRRRVCVLGFGEAGPEEVDSAELLDGASSRGLNRSSRVLTIAAIRALAAAGVSIRGDLRERSGIVLGAARVPQDSKRAFEQSVDRDGLAHLSAAAFSRIVLNAPAGACAKLLSLRGPNLALSTGPDSGMVAVFVAAQLLAGRDDVEILLTGGLERDRGDADSARLLLLGCGHAGDRCVTTGEIELDGWALAGPGQAHVARARALEMAGSDDGRTLASFGEIGDALEALEARSTQRAVVTWTGERSAAGCISLSRRL
jgi:3-oxoacyl-[acyl-carrier-protein] synthase II